MLLVGWFTMFFLPVYLTIHNIIFLVINRKSQYLGKWEGIIEILTMYFGFYFTRLNIDFSEIKMHVDWMEMLPDLQDHTPIWTGGQLSVLFFIILAAVGYIVLRIRTIDRLPPLLAVICMATMGIGVVLCAVWCAQVYDNRSLSLCWFPFNCILMAAKVIRNTLYTWSRMQNTDAISFKNKYLQKLNEKVIQASSLPVCVFLIMIPIVIIGILILVLLGQAPDAIIQAWTNTSDWSLSKQVAPQPPQTIQVDQHYLCTVAAGGHKKVVKPKRMGIRHGHTIVVNRQLLIANAFEQVLEERIPRIHRFIRKFYDTYGLPIARMIRSKYIADSIYFLMKPLEWCFLAVLYLVDVKPENRIAMQYITPITNVNSEDIKESLEYNNKK